MGIGKKIEQIRKSPEHIRERYVWLTVGICMFFIFSVWIFSLMTVFKQKEQSETALPIKELIEKSKGSMGEISSIEDIRQEAGALIE